MEVMRKNKTRQDQMPAGKRDRSLEWERRREWAKKHKPRRSADWLKFKKTSG